MASKSRTHLGSTGTAENNRRKEAEAHEVLTELVNYAISCGKRGSVTVRINFNPGWLSKVRKGMELDTNGEAG